METRICNICNLEKPLSDEFFRKSIFIKKDGTKGISFMRKCLICHNKWQTENYFSSKFPKQDDGYNFCKYCEKKYPHNQFETAFMCIFCFKDKKSEQDKRWRKDNKEKKSTIDKEYQINNKYEISQKKKEYYLVNKSKFIERNIRNEKIRRQTDPAFRLRKSVSACIKKAINKNGKSFTKYISYTIIELKEHLESQFESWMNWDNHGVYKIKEWDDKDPSTWKWNIDHIIPHSNFKYTSMEDDEFKKCWALENLRPYSAKQNILDNNRK